VFYQIILRISVFHWVPLQEYNTMQGPLNVLKKGLLLVTKIFF